MIEHRKVQEYASALEEAYKLLFGSSGDINYCPTINFNGIELSTSISLGTVRNIELENNNCVLAMYKDHSANLEPEELVQGVLALNTGRIYIPELKSDKFTVVPADTLRDDYFSLSTVHEPVVLDYALVLQEFHSMNVLDPKDITIFKDFNFSLLDKFIEVLPSLSSIRELQFKVHSNAREQ